MAIHCHALITNIAAKKTLTPICPLNALLTMDKIYPIADKIAIVNIITFFLLYTEKKYKSYILFLDII